MRVLRVVGVFLLWMLGSGCATIIHGTTQEIPVTSEPPGATVATTGDVKTTTPGKLELKRKTGHVLTFTKEGYKPETTKLESVLSGAVAGNIIAGGLIGWGVDAATGGDSRLVPESVHVILKPLDPVAVLLIGPSGAEVRVGDQIHTTDQTGILSLALKPGSYSVAVNKPGFEPYNEALTVESDKPLRRNISLVPARDTPTSTPPTPASAEPASPTGQAVMEGSKELEKRLQALKDLREKNLISEDQYQSATKELLKKLTE